jgi:5,10-methylenetetrahydromethanopterin reductase
MWQIGSRTIELGLGIWQSYPYRRLLDLVAQAETIGYDYLWIGNEKFYRDMWVMLGLVAAHARRAKVGTFVAEPYTYHPALIAAAIATADEALGGRTILLLGAGATGFRQIGLKRHKPLAAVEETIKVVRRLLKGETVTFRGEVIEVNDTQLHFETRADIPIWVASRGNMMLKMAGREADGVVIATYATPTGIQHGIDQVAAGAEEAGRSSVPITVRVDVCLDDDDGAARAAVKPMIAGMIKASAPNRDFVDQVGLDLPDDFYRELLATEFTDMHRIVHRLPEAFVDAYSWAGTPEQIAQKVAAVVDMGIDRITFLPHTSTVTGTAESMVQRFTNEVMPRIVALARGD